MGSPAISDDRSVESALEALIKKLLYAKSSPDSKKALIEARRLKGITQKWGAIPPQPDAKKELLARMNELTELADGLEPDPDKVGKDLPASSSLESSAHVSRSGAHAIGGAVARGPVSDAPAAVRTPLRDEKTAPDGALIRASVLKGMAFHDEPTQPVGKPSRAAKPSIHEEKTAPGRRFPSIHDEKTAPDGALPPAAAFRTLPPDNTFDDEPTNPSASIPEDLDEPAPVSSRARGSRAKERRAIARGKGAIPLSRSPAPGLNMENVAQGEWTPCAERVGFRVLMHDEEANRCVALVKLDAKANVASSHAVGPAEVTVILGTAFVSGSELNAGETCTIAEGTQRPAIASQDGAVLLYSGSDDDECVRAR